MDKKLQMLTGVKMPFCPGCGHGPSTISISKALQQAGYKPLDVVMVSDIGCSGLVDPLFATHTVHGLHGRSTAFGLGIALGLSDPAKKVVVIQGDGGATIGLQHMLEAARRNVNMTLIVLNNLIYGMTGGQISGLSTNEFKDARQMEDVTPPFDICLLAKHAGAPYSARVTSPRNFSERLLEAFTTPGFSLVEISSLCQPYGAGKMHDLENWTGEETIYKNKRQLNKTLIKNTPPLFDMHNPLNPCFKSSLNKSMGIVLAGSAGGGIQSTAKILALAGMLSGLSVSMKGEYPITVGTGFSVAEVILSRKVIHYTGLETADVMIAVTEDGLLKVKEKICEHTSIVLDSKLHNAQIPHAVSGAFHKTAGKKGAALCALAWWINQNGIFPVEALEAAVAKHKYAVRMKEFLKASSQIKIIHS